MRTGISATNDALIFDWNATDEPPRSPLPPLVHDETLREGIQSPSSVDMPLPAKLEIVDCLEQLGVASAALGFPAAGDRMREDARELVRHVRDQRYSIRPGCASRALAADLAPVAGIQQELGVAVRTYAFLGASPLRQHVEGWGADFLIRTLDAAMEFAGKENLEVAFVTEDTTRSHPDLLGRLFTHVLDRGCRRIVLCDTVGHATPEGSAALVGWTRQLAEARGLAVELEWHGHNDRGLALANTLAAHRAGCRTLHATSLGVGERAGNASLEHLLANLKLMGLYAGDLRPVRRLSELLARHFKIRLPANYPMLGENAFRTSSGVHAASLLKARKVGGRELEDRVYSGVPASWFGEHQIIEVGPMSGLANVRYWLEANGYPPTAGLAETMLRWAKARNRVLKDGQLHRLAKRALRAQGVAP